MNTKIRCPECETSLRITEKHFGRTVKCPRCGASVKVPTPDTDDLDDFSFDEQEAPDYEEQPRRRSSRQPTSGSSRSSKRGKKSPQQTNSNLLVAVGAGAVVVVCVVGLLFWMKGRTGQSTIPASSNVAVVAPQLPPITPENPMMTNPATPSNEPATPAITAANPVASPSLAGMPPAANPVAGTAGAVELPIAGATASAGAATPATGVEDLSTLTERVGRGLVLIRIKDANGQNLGLGSGFLISKDGLVATNFHVMQDGSTAEAEFRDGTRVPITGYRAFDEKRDLAIVQLESVPADATPLELATTLDIKQGSAVVAMGHPRGLRFTATEGIVSAIHKTSELPPDLRRQMPSPDDQVWIQTSATIFSGNSGGPLLSRSGKVVGINSWITRDVDFGFAMAIQHLIDLQPQVKESVLGLAEVNRQSRADDTLLNLGDLDPKVKAIRDEFQLSFEEFQVHLRTAKTADEVRRILTSKNPARRDVPRLIKLANENANSLCSYQSLIFALAMLRQYYPETTATTPMQQVTTQLLRDHLNEKTITIAAILASSFDLPAAKAFLGELIAKSTDRDVQGVACFMLARTMISSDKPAPRKEGAKLLKRVIDEFSDVVIRGEPIVEEAQKMLFALEHLTVGAEAPEIIGMDAEGNEMKLSDFRGKVVMLDFFANWCPHCVKMYPLERIMVEKQKDRPYVLLGVNCDAPGVLEQLIQEKKVTWQCWADGVEGPIATEWQLSAYPTIYVIDHQGIIRYQFFGAPDPDEIDRALGQLVAKAKSGNKKPTGGSGSGTRTKSRAPANP